MRLIWLTASLLDIRNVRFYHPDIHLAISRRKSSCKDSFWTNFKKKKKQTSSNPDKLARSCLQKSQNSTFLEVLSGVLEQPAGARGLSLSGHHSHHSPLSRQSIYRPRVLMATEGTCGIHGFCRWVPAIFECFCCVNGDLKLPFGSAETRF